MLVLFLMLLTAAITAGNNECDNFLVLEGNEVKELLNPSYPLKDDPGKSCTWSVIADVDRRIVLVCPFNDGSDTRSDKRVQCGAEMSVWDVGGEPTTYCRDQTFTRLGNSNRMFINYTNDDGTFYNRTSGFKCYVYATFTSLFQPYDVAIKDVYEKALFRECDYFIQLSKYDIVRLASSKYTEDREKWRRCRWTALSPEDSKISVTCPYTEKPPHPVLISAEPCTSEFTTRVLQYSQVYPCSTKAFAAYSSKNRIVLEELSIRRLPAREFECYVHSKPLNDTTTLKPSPYETCDHYIELNGTVTLRTPNHPEYLDPGTTCRWTVVAPENHQISLNCRSTEYDDGRRQQGEVCFGEFFVTLPGGKVIHYCRQWATTFTPIYSHYGMTIIYNNPEEHKTASFECTVSLSPDGQCQNCTDTETQNGKAYKIIKLKKREVIELLSPNYPQKEPAGSTARWTVVTDADRRIVLVCPFYHSIEKVYTLGDPQPCNGKFTVSPDNEEKSHHCQDRGFYRIGINRVMVITYENPLTEPLDAFKCYVYAELKARWDPPVYYNESDAAVEEFNYEITLDGVNTTTLVPPSGPEDEEKMWRIRWKVSALNGGNVTLACHFTKKPPAPLTIQVVPCSGLFKVEISEGEQTQFCSDGAFTHTGTGWIVLVYENLYKQLADDFLCVVYSTNSKISNEVTSKAYENDACDYLIYLRRMEMRNWDSSHYNVERNCRWTFVAPTNSRIVLACPYHSTNDEMPTKETLRCHDQLTVFTEGQNKTMHCSETTFTRTSDNNRMVLIYENELGEPSEPFRCQIYVEDYEIIAPPLPYGEIGVKELNLTSFGRGSINSPKYPANETSGWIIRWSVEAPPDSRVLLSCLNKPPSLQVDQDQPCSAFLTVSTEDRLNTTYCQDTAFVRASANNKMLITYDNPSEQPTQSFKCFFYLEQKWPWNECENCNMISSLPYKNCDYLLNLADNSMTDLKLPEDYTKGTSCRWTVVSPPDSRIFISCPQNDITPKTNDTCGSYYTVSTAGNVDTYCPTEIVNHPSITNWAIFTYENPSRDTVNKFLCFAYVEKQVSSAACVNCNELEKLDYSNCNSTIHLNEVGASDLLQTANFPAELQPGIPCLWTVRSPPLTSISLICDLGAFADATSVDNEFCRGLITVYRPGKNPKYTCRHQSFGVASADNKLIVTYGNQHGLSTKGFKCNVRAFNSTCHKKIPLGHLQYNEFYKIIGPSWTSSDQIPASCIYSIQAPTNTKIFLICDGKPERKESMAVYTAGDRDTADPSVFSLNTAFKISSVNHEMALVYILDETSRNSSDTGCRIHVDRAEALGPECNCGNKYNKMSIPPLPLRDPVRGPSRGLFSPANTFPMVAAIIRSEPFTVICVATIISKYHALSAAHCFEGEFELSLLFGAHKTAADGRSSQLVITRHMLHPNYKKGDPQNDIAVSVVRKQIIFGEYVQPACLPLHGRGRSLVKEKITFLGWKKGDENKDRNTLLNSDVMLKSVGHLGSLLECSTAFGHYETDKTWCVLLPLFRIPPKPHSCPDEKGGHIYWKDPQTGLMKVIGIDITRGGCDIVNRFKNYFHAELLPIGNYVDWIQSTLTEVRFCDAE